jgi:hypothetical protein
MASKMSSTASIKATNPDGLDVPPASIAIGTRIHLGNASAPPALEQLQKTVESFTNFCSSIHILETHAYIAVDATPKFGGYDLVEMIQGLLESSSIQVIPVTPWNKFTPALNAIVSKAAYDKCDYCLMVSAETRASQSSVQRLLDHHESDTLVVGAVLPGHDYHADSIQPLNGRTSPWNTLALWNVSKLALTGFSLVAEGLHIPSPDNPAAVGVEEVSTIAVLQHILGIDQAKAKLVALPDVQWDQQFEDEERRKWHEAKMNSKLERAQRHLDLLGLTGIVRHVV